MRHERYVDHPVTAMRMGIGGIATRQTAIGDGGAPGGRAARYGFSARPGERFIVRPGGEDDGGAEDVGHGLPVTVLCEEAGDDRFRNPLPRARDTEAGFFAPAPAPALSPPTPLPVP